MKTFIVVVSFNVFLALDIFHRLLYGNSTLIDIIIYNKQINLIFAGILEIQISDHQTIVINTTHRPPPCKSKYISIVMHQKKNSKHTLIN